LDTCWSGSTVRDKLRSKFIKTTERNKKIFAQTSSAAGPARISKPMTPSSNSKPKNTHKFPIILIEESIEPSKFKHKNSLLENNLKTIRTVDRTAFETYNNRTKGRNIKSPICDNVMMQSFSSSRRHECNTLREQLQKITIDLDNTLSQPQKARRTRKERRLNTMTNNSRNGTTVLIHDNISINNVETGNKAKCKQELKNAVYNHLDNHNATAREKTNFKLSAKENSKLISQATPRTNSKLNKIVPVHRRCFTRTQAPMISLNGKDKKGQVMGKQVESKIGDIGKPTCSSVNKRNIISKQPYKQH